MILLFLLSIGAMGQDIVSKKTKTFVIEQDTIVLDTNSLVWGSIEISNLQPTDYTIDYLRGLLIIKNPAIKKQNISVSYRCYPYSLGEKKQRYSTDLIEKHIYNPIIKLNTTPLEQPTFDEIFSDSKLNTYGSLSRGISIGNSQDMIVNSNLNLQLSGKLSEDIEILATITDQNIPIQPEGNSAQLQEFDKVFIQMKYKDKATLLAGDVENESNGNAYFMSYRRMGQGLKMNTDFQSINKKKDTTHYNINFSGTVAKGVYCVQNIIPIESNQGPYRLVGKNNETYIIILAGSERVYINEVLLQRGEDNDYVINYNSGEITFTAKQVITKDKRIVVEYEYVDQSYLHSTMLLDAKIEHKKWAFRFNLFSEQDHKNQTNSLELNNEQKQFLSSLDKGIDKAILSNIDSVGFQSNEIMYKMIDTIVNGIIYDSVFVYSNNPDSAYYRLGFSLVGDHQGNYILSESIVNGRVYVWVAPINGIPQGNYAPIQQISTPKCLQMYAIGIDYQVHKTTKLSFDAALSNNDINTFSKKDNSDNIGYGLKINLLNETDLKKKTSQLAHWKMNLEAFYETKNNTFSYIDDYQDKDFRRNYNINDTLMNNSYHYMGIDINFKHIQKGSAKLASELFLIPTYNYYGNRNFLAANYQTKGVKMGLEAAILKNRQLDFETQFIQHKEVISSDLKFVNIGIANEMEVNFYQTLLHKIMPESFASNELTFFIKNSDSLSNYAFGLNYTNRIDADGIDSVLSNYAIAHQIGANLDILKLKNNILRFNASYRYLDYRDSIGENTLLTNLDYQARWFKGAIQMGLYYEIGSGMEEKKEYSYLKVVDGQGVYQWIDYNNNGIEELNEYEVAKYQYEANYIRLWRTSNQYIKTFNNQFSGSFILRPASVWRQEKGIKKFLARFANTTTYRSLYKNTLQGLVGMFNPFYINVTDTNLVTASGNFRNVFSFNQMSSIWGAEVIYNNSQSKNLTVNGFEAFDVYSCLVNTRWNIKQSFTFNANYENGFKIRKSEYMNKNYNLYQNTLTGIFSYQYKTNFKLSCSYAYTQKNNKIDDNELYIGNKASIEVNYRIVKRGNLIFKTDYYYILFRGNTNSSVAYEMLEALQAGNNLVFHLNFQTTLLENLQLNINYEGRISSGEKMKHLASVDLRAFF